MILGPRSSLKQVSVAVGATLKEHGIHAVLTGGAAASIHSGGQYVSGAADFILSGRVDRSVLDQAMVGLGFRREGNRYFHRATKFFVEFPAGPLAIGSDVHILPIDIHARGRTALALSATDSCRDRLSAFFHWGDRQSLEVAVQIAMRSQVDWIKVESWSEKEGASALFQEFRELVQSRGKKRIASQKKRKRSARKR